MGFVRTIVRRQVAAHIDEVVHTRKEETSIDQGSPLPDHSHSPEDRAISQEKLDVMMRTLRGMSGRDREILTRFYLQEQPQDQICKEMHLTDTQFRLLKSRAKARFGEMGRRRLEVTWANSHFRESFPGSWPLDAQETPIAGPHSGSGGKTMESIQDGSHIPDDTIGDYALGRLPKREVPGVFEHLLLCNECNERYEAELTFRNEFREALTERRAHP